jgi:hypothetical protein
MTSVGSIVGGAFGLVRRHPVSVLVWGLLYMASVGLLLLAMRPIFAVYSDLISQQMALGPKAMMNPQELQPYIARMQAAGGIVFLAEIGVFALIVILFTATQRAILRPAERGFFFLRLGGDELRLIGLGLVLAVCFNVAFFIAMLLMIIPVAIVGAASGSPAATITLAMLEFLVLMGAIVYIEVRLSLAFPLTFLRRSFVVGEAWQLTRGRFWTLFGAYFVLALVYMLLSLILFGIAIWPLVSELAQDDSTPEAIRVAAVHWIEAWLTLDARTVGLMLGGALLGGLTLALFGGAMATAVRDLVGGDRAPPDTAGARPA